MSEENVKRKYNAVCTHCGAGRFVWLVSLIGAAPVFCSCGSIMTLSASDMMALPQGKTQDTPSASNVRRVEVPAAELCLLGDMTLLDGKRYPREEVFRAIMRYTFGDEAGLAGYKEI